jgi:hypothetical protein
MEIMNNTKYKTMLNNMVTKGTPEDSRIGPMFEQIGYSISIPSNLLLYRPGMARKLGWVEALMVIAGSFDERLIQLAAPNLVHPYTVHQAYGLKLAQQFPMVANQLRNVEGTRRAMLHIGKPADGFETEKPCIQSYQFLQRDGHLHMVASIRSWDLVSGFIYDVMVMGLVNQVMARVLELHPGIIHAHAGSAHVYEVDVEKFPTTKDGRKARAYQISNDLTFGSWESAAFWAQRNLRNFGYWFDNRIPDGLEYTE